MKYSTVLFDLDGTLTDPVQGICGSVRYALEKAGRSVGPIESYHKYIGPPLLRSFEVYANATPEEAQELLGYYRERFSTVGLFENEVYPGIPELLRDLKASGVRLAVATWKPTVFSEQILEHFELRQYFDIVSGIPLNREPPDKCEVILAIGIALIGQKHKFDIRTFLQTMPEFLCRPNLSLTGCTPHCPEIQNNIATRV